MLFNPRGILTCSSQDGAKRNIFDAVAKILKMSFIGPLVLMQLVVAKVLSLEKIQPSNDRKKIFPKRLPYAVNEER